MYLKDSAGHISVTDELLHQDGRIRVRAIAKYLLFKKGPLATTGCDHGAFVSTAGMAHLSCHHGSQYVPSKSVCVCKVLKEASQLPSKELFILRQSSLHRSACSVAARRVAHGAINECSAEISCPPQGAHRENRQQSELMSASPHMKESQDLVTDVSAWL